MVLLGLRGGGAPGWLVAVSIAVNVLFVVVAALSLARGGTTPLGSAVHVVLILSGAAVATLIVILSRRRLGTGRGGGAAIVE